MVGKAGPGGCYARWAPALSVMGSAQLSRLHDVNVGMAGSDGRFVRSVPALSVTGTTVTGIGGAAIANRRLLRVEDSAPSSSGTRRAVHTVWFASQEATRGALARVVRSPRRESA